MGGEGERKVRGERERKGGDCLLHWILDTKCCTASQ